MGHPLATTLRLDNEAPYQLYAELRCRGLRVSNPIHEAIWEGKELDRKRKEGVILLRECRVEAPHG